MPINNAIIQVAAASHGNTIAARTPARLGGLGRLIAHKSILVDAPHRFLVEGSWCRQTRRVELDVLEMQRGNAALLSLNRLHFEARRRPGGLVWFDHEGIPADQIVECCYLNGFEILSADAAARADADAAGVAVGNADGGMLLRVFETAPSTLRMGARLLVVGINPSPMSASMGIPFGRKGNRFWPGMLASGACTLDRDPLDLVRVGGIAMTDISKRVTRRADELSREEIREGYLRLERMVRWLRPQAVAILGVTTWRIARADPSVALGLQSQTLGDCEVWVLPNPSGLNAHTSVEDFSNRINECLRSPTSSAF